MHFASMAKILKVSSCHTAVCVVICQGTVYRKADESLKCGPSFCSGLSSYPMARYNPDPDNAVCPPSAVFFVTIVVPGTRHSSVVVVVAILSAGGGAHVRLIRIQEPFSTLHCNHNHNHNNHSSTYLSCKLTTEAAKPLCNREDLLQLDRRSTRLGYQDCPAQSSRVTHDAAPADDVLACLCCKPSAIGRQGCTGITKRWLAVFHKVGCISLSVSWKSFPHWLSLYWRDRGYHFRMFIRC